MPLFQGVYGERRLWLVRTDQTTDGVLDLDQGPTCGFWTLVFPEDR